MSNLEERFGVDADAVVIQAARDAGIPVINDPDFHADPAVARLVPADTGIIPLGFSDGYLDVGFSAIPTPTEFERVSGLVGVPIRIVLCTRAAYHALQGRWVSAAATTRPPLEGVLDAAHAAGASDVHLAVGVPPILRIAGRLTPIAGWGPLSAGDLDDMARYVAGDVAFADTFTGEHDSAITYGSARYRVALFRQRQTLSLVLRMIPTEIPEFSALALPPAIAGFADCTHGLVLICGATGSGKSTTLASIIDRINRTRSCHVLTVEDPVEFIHPSRRALVRQREVGEDTRSFGAALRAALRSDPDVILVGEMRDLETISMAVSASETGHLVLATLHAQTAHAAIDRMIDAFPAEQQNQIRVQLASTLVGVVCQTLLPAADNPGKRHAVCEVLVVTPAVRAMIRDGSTHQLSSVLQSGVDEHGMQSMDLGLARAVAAGKVNLEDVEALIQDRTSFREYLTRLRDGRIGNPS